MKYKNRPTGKYGMLGLFNAGRSLSIFIAVMNESTANIIEPLKWILSLVFDWPRDNFGFNDGLTRGLSVKAPVFFLSLFLDLSRFLGSNPNRFGLRLATLV